MPSRFTKYSLWACAALCLLAAPPFFSWMTSYFPCFKLELVKRPVMDDEVDILEYVGNVSTAGDVHKMPAPQDESSGHPQIRNAEGQTKEKTVNPKAKTEEKTANPKAKAEEKTANPKAKAEEKKDNSKAKTEEKKDNSKAKTEEKKDNSKAKAEEKKDNSKTKAEEKKDNSKAKTEEKKDNSKAKTEEKKDNSKAKTEEKTGSPKEQTKKKTEETPKIYAPPPRKKTKYIDRPILQKTLYPLTLNAPYILHNPKICRGLNPLHLLILVHTATAHFQQRQAIRSTWAGKTLMKTRTQRLVFLLGQTPDQATQHMLENELLTHGDLLQGPFLDSYHNLTHKGVMAYRWVYEHCSHAQLIFKVDDDVFVNPFLFYDTLYRRFRKQKRTIACEVQRAHSSPIFREKTNKWRVDPFVFRGFKHYPPVHCRGYAVIITADIVRALYWAGFTTPFFWVDDVYLYGMLPAKVGNITHIDIRTSFTTNTDSTVRCYQRGNCRTVATEVKAEAKFYKLWKMAKTQIPPGIKADVNTTYLNT